MIGAAAIVLGLLLAVSSSAEPPSVSGSTAPANWPPAVDTLVGADGCSAPPPCDPSAAPSDALPAIRSWRRVIQTTASDCPFAVKQFDARTRLGNVQSEPMALQLRGSCVVDAEGRTGGAVHNGVLASCEVKPQPFGARSFEAGVIDLASGKGHGQAPLRGLPWLLAGTSACEILVDIELQPLNKDVASPGSATP